MGQRLKRKIFHVEGMTCSGCEFRIENALNKIEGVLEAKAIFSSSNVFVTYDANMTGVEQIIQTIEKLDYSVKNPVGEPGKNHATYGKAKVGTEGNASGKMPAGQLLGVVIIVIALYIIIKNTVGFDFIPQVNQSMGYGILFVVGFLTSLHCISMCGGINLSQCVTYKVEARDATSAPDTRDGQKSGRLSKLKPSLLYNTGRVVSYTIIGGIVGVLGAGISFSGAARGIVAIVSGAFMVIMGLNMLNIFPWLRKINPRMPKIFTGKIRGKARGLGPFFVGLLNGLMPCGPLQSMQLYALGTGSFVAGALSMFMFSLGTVPLMFGLGALSSVLSGKFTHKMMKASAVLVIVLGVVMANRGLALSGISIPDAFSGKNTAKGSGTAIVQENENVQIVVTRLSPGRYEPITVQKDIPVRWIIKAEKKDINGCNNEIVIPKFNKTKKLEPGDNIIEFTPTETGTFAYSCWMGMIRSKITVVDDLKNTDDSGADESGTDGGVQKSDYKIPVDKIAVAEIKDGRQYIDISVEGDRFSPAVLVMQSGIETLWNINIEKLDDSNGQLIFPVYNTLMNMDEGENVILFIPGVDFDFCTVDYKFYGYVKVVEDINNVDIEAIKEEVNQYVPLKQEIIDYSGLPSCH